MDFIVNMFDNMPVNVVVVFLIFSPCTVDAPITINRGDNHTCTHYKGDMAWPLDCVSLPPDEAAMSCRWWTWSDCLPMSNSNSIHGLLVVDTGQSSPPLLNENEREESAEPKPCGQPIPPRVGDAGPLSPCDAHGCGSDVSVVHVSSSPGRDMAQCHAEVIFLLKELLDGQRTGVTPAGGPSACVTRCTPLLSGLQCSRPSFPRTTLTTFCRSLKTHTSTITESILQQWYHFSPMNTDVFLHVHFTSVLHSHCANVPGSAEWQPDALTLSQDAPRGKSTSNSTSHLTKQRHQETLDRPNGKSFVNQPFWSKMFTFHQNHKRRDDINNRVDSLLVKLLYPLVIIMTIIYRYLPLIRKEEKGKNGNIIYFRLLTHSFFLKWQWTRPQNVSTVETIKNLKGITLKEAEHPSVATRTDKKTPQTNIFNEHILRPWLYKGRLGHIESSLGNEQAHTRKGFSHMPPTSHPRVHGRYHVNPSTRFLPDATFNPALDLAHPGYRLATLSALPPTVPVSRVKLADAGFYFRGQGDDVTCYSCQQRHSGWSRDDNPMDVHRRLSPTCEHVLQADRERQASTPSAGPSSTSSAGPSSTPTAGLASTPTAGQASASAANGQESSSPAEDGEGPDPTPPPHPDPIPPPHRAAAPLETTPSIDRLPLPAHSNAGSSLLHQGVPPAPTTAAGSAESRQNTTNGHALETEPPGERQAEQQAIVSSSWRSSSTAATSASSGVQPLSRPAENTLSGSLGNAARGSEPRFVFPRAALDLGGAVYPMYQDMASRRRSFTTWDDSRAPPLDQVLLCGMFYAGYADCVRCFYCGVGLKHWVATDDVWTEHARWRPDCGYLRAVKGDNFIQDILTRLRGEAASSAQDGENADDGTPPSRTRDNSEGRQPSPRSASATAGTIAATTTSSAVSQAPAAVTSTRGDSQGSPAGARSSAAGGSSNGQGEVSGLTSVPGATDAEQLARLQQENRAMSSRFQCQSCRQATIDTILMPCGHLVVCQNCARSVTSCPLCHDRVEATARVHLA